MPKQLPVSNLFMRQLVYQNVIHLKIQIMTTIYTFAQSAIEEAQNAGRYGTANLYTSAIKSFRKFTGDMPLTFKELTPGLIKNTKKACSRKGGATTPYQPICVCCAPSSTKRTYKAFPMPHLPTNCFASYSQDTSLPPSGPSLPPLYAAFHS